MAEDSFDPGKATEDLKTRTEWRATVGKEYLRRVTEGKIEERIGRSQHDAAAIKQGVGKKCDANLVREILEDAAQELPKDPTIQQLAERKDGAWQGKVAPHIKEAFAAADTEAYLDIDTPEGERFLRNERVRAAVIKAGYGADAVGKSRGGAK